MAILILAGASFIYCAKCLQSLRSGENRLAGVENPPGDDSPGERVRCQRVNFLVVRQPPDRIGGEPCQRRMVGRSHWSGENVEPLLHIGEQSIDRPDILAARYQPVVGEDKEIGIRDTASPMPGPFPSQEADQKAR